MSENKNSGPAAGRVHRRTVLKGMAGAAAVALLPRGAQAAAEQGSARSAKMAADGKLPKLADRLPANPLVVETREKIGTYGGMWRRGLSGSNDHNGILRCVGNMGLTRWDFDFTKVRAQCRRELGCLRRLHHLHVPPAQGHEVVGRRALHRGRRGVLDRGLRQEPRTLSVGARASCRSAARALMVTKIDDYTVQFKFAAPYGLFLRAARHPARPAPDAVLQALRDAVPAEIQRQARRHGQGVGHDQAGRTCSAPRTATSRSRRAGAIRTSRCSIRGLSADPYVGGATRVVAKRNPYFWQVDSQGQPVALSRRHHFPDLPGRRIAPARRASPARSTCRSGTSTAPEQADPGAEQGRRATTI